MAQGEYCCHLSFYRLEALARKMTEEAIMAKIVRQSKYERELCQHWYNIQATKKKIKQNRQIREEQYERERENALKRTMELESMVCNVMYRCYC